VRHLLGAYQATDLKPWIEYNGASHTYADFLASGSKGHAANKDIVESSWKIHGKVAVSATPNHDIFLDSDIGVKTDGRRDQLCL
jgi:hypothetical protein